MHKVTKEPEAQKNFYAQKISHKATNDNIQMKEAAFLGQLLFLVIAERHRGMLGECFLVTAERQKEIALLNNKGVKK